MLNIYLLLDLILVINMSYGGTDKTKARLLIRAYLLFNDSATASELAVWLNDNFKWNKRVSPRVIGGLLKDNQSNGVLYDLGKSKRGYVDGHGDVYEYFLKKSR